MAASAPLVWHWPKAKRVESERALPVGDSALLRCAMIRSVAHDRATRNLAIRLLANQCALIEARLVEDVFVPNNIGLSLCFFEIRGELLVPSLPLSLQPTR
jgi:hypothetical protein